MKEATGVSRELLDTCSATFGHLVWCKDEVFAWLHIFNGVGKYYHPSTLMPQMFGI